MIDEGTEAADILKFIEEVNHLKDVDTVLDRVLYRSRQVTRADAGSIFLLDGDRLRFLARAHGVMTLRLGFQR